MTNKNAIALGCQYLSKFENFSQKLITSGFDDSVFHSQPSFPPQPPYVMDEWAGRQSDSVMEVAGSVTFL